MMKSKIEIERPPSLSWGLFINASVLR